MLLDGSITSVPTLRIRFHTVLRVRTNFLPDYLVEIGYYIKFPLVKIGKRELTFLLSVPAY